MLSFEYRGLGEIASLSDYQETWDYQRAVHAEVADGARGDHAIYVEHSPVYTAGRRTDPADHPVDGTPVIPVDRGGEITYHGPGQLVGYPILALADGVGVVDYVRALEETRDTAELPEASGEAIAREFERYLKRREHPDE